MDAPVTREERYCFHRRGMRPADRPSPALSNAGLGGNGGLDERGDALLDLGGDLRAGGQAGLQDVLDLDAEVLDLRPGQAGLRGRVLGDRTDLALQAGSAPGAPEPPPRGGGRCPPPPPGAGGAPPAPRPSAPRVL